MKSTYRFVTLFLMALLLCTAFHPVSGQMFLPVTGSLESSVASDPTTVPGLDQFSQQVRNGLATQVTGIYAENLFAFPVVQQPQNQPGYVSTAADTITEFRSAQSFGSLGFLAHNTLAGGKFSGVSVGGLLAVVYGDGHSVLYQVKQVLRFQAVEPKNPYSSFIDLASGKTLTAEELFYATYGVKEHLILQTCISAAGNDSWGRLFLIAEPYIPPGTQSIR